MNSTVSQSEVERKGLQILLEEPFRLFFPLGVFGGLCGVWPWVAYHLGWADSYSAYGHGLLQIQAFEMAFAVGFLMTVLPRFLETDGARPWELVVGWALCAAGMVALVVGAWRLGEGLFLCLALHLSLFGLRRLHSRGDDPPPFFAFLPAGLGSAIFGSCLILCPQVAFPRLGELLVEQGILLAFVLAVGSHLGPRLLYGHRGFPETTTPAAHRRLGLLGGVAVALLTSFVLESGWHAATGQVLRAAIVSAYLFGVLRVDRTPTNPWIHLHLLRGSLISLCLGLWLPPLFPQHALAALHLSFVGGFGLMTIIVATRVVTGHCDAERLWVGNHWPVSLPALLIALAVPVRLAADIAPLYYFQILAVAGSLWLAGLVLWGLYFVPLLRPSRVTPD
ncbi:MAG TPA: hypothetical protein DGN59_05045 [Candidatus Latescibacteria bacterium]|nr:hypothetical protein [Candidatus Latescibacterota bacterium]